MFHTLGKDEIAAIVDIQVRLLEQRLANRRLSVTLSPAAREHLAVRGYDAAFGARPLKRLIQKEVQDPLAMKLLSGELKEGDTVEIDRDGQSDALVFRTAPPEAQG